MGSTFVTLRRDKFGNQVSGAEEVGFWMRDGTLELWLRLLALHIENPSQPGIANVIRDQWLLASGIHFNGMVPHGLDEATATPEGFEIVRKAVASLSGELARTSGPISGKTLNLLGLDEGWGGDIDVEDLRDVAGAFLDLLDFKVEATAHSTERMPGSVSAPWRALPG